MSPRISSRSRPVPRGALDLQQDPEGNQQEST